MKKMIETRSINRGSAYFVVHALKGGHLVVIFAVVIDRINWNTNKLIVSTITRRRSDEQYKTRIHKKYYMPLLRI